jgi:hypothetical protein
MQLTTGNVGDFGCRNVFSAFGLGPARDRHRISSELKKALSGHRFRALPSSAKVGRDVSAQDSRDEARFYQSIGGTLLADEPLDLATKEM